MADTKISVASDIGTLQGTDKVPIARSGSSTAYAATMTAIASFSGLVKLASGTIGSAVAYLDLALPAGYAEYYLECIGVTFSVADQFSLAMSQDGGSTFLCDATNFDTYLFSNSSSNYGTGSTGQQSSGTDSLAYLAGSDDPAANIGDHVVLEINPGSAARWPLIHGRRSGGTPTLSSSIGAMTLNPSATTTPTRARVNAIRLLPYGNGDCAPPTSGETITAGYYVLWGITL